MEWFLYDRNLRHERPKVVSQPDLLTTETFYGLLTLSHVVFTKRLCTYLKKPAAFIIYHYLFWVFFR